MKKIRILCEKACAESIWCKQLFSGLVKELKKRRIGFEQDGDISKEDGVCMIGMSNEWTQSEVARCNERGCVPIVLSTQSGRTVKGEYHLICSDMEGVTKDLKEAFVSAGRKKIALYGAGHTSDLDKDRSDVFSELVSGSQNIFRNTGNLEYCFRSFLPKAARFDGVVCVNGYAAISLVKKLEKENPQILKQTVIVSCEEVLRHSKYNQWVSYVDLNLESYGKVGLSVLELTEHNREIGNITIKMKGTVCEIPKKSEKTKDTAAAEELQLKDPEIISMERIEQLLRDADDLDHHIIAMLLSDATYSEISDSCYMTEGNIKYRVKKYMSICECRTKKELLELLREYLQ